MKIVGFSFTKITIIQSLEPNEVKAGRMNCEYISAQISETHWLHDSAQAPVPWHHMFHVAEAVAGDKPLKDIPLMFSIAEVSVVAALERGISHDH